MDIVYIAAAAALWLITFGLALVCASLQPAQVKR